jgi:hypothetical protein
MNHKHKLSVVDFSPTRARQQEGEAGSKTVKPTPDPKPTSILDARFNYTSASATDLRAKFKAMGFKTPKPKKPQFGK